MSNTTYLVDQIALGTTAQRSDASGIDWIDMAGSGFIAAEVNLAWRVTNGVIEQAYARLYYQGNTTRSLLIDGIIENVRGSTIGDYIIGNTGRNVIYGDQSSTGPGGNDTIFGDAGDDLVFGGRGNDSINGAADNDRLYGDGGNDTLNGAGGVDTIEGGAGADVLSGGADIGDTLSYASSGAAVRVELALGFCTVSGGHATGDTVTGFTDVIGSVFGDVIIDTVKGFNGSNINEVFAGGGNDTVTLGGGNDTAYGGDGNDRLTGEAGNDVLSGQGGADTLRGGQGADTLIGGAGADRFVFAFQSDSTVALAGRDRIQDFRRADGDRIDLSGIDANAGVSGNQAFTFIGKAAAFSAAGQLRIVDAGDFLVVLGNTDRDAQAEFAIRVDGVANLFAGDFIL